jgi:hypothetical protein
VFIGFVLFAAILSFSGAYSKKSLFFEAVGYCPQPIVIYGKLAEMQPFGAKRA